MMEKKTTVMLKASKVTGQPITEHAHFAMVELRALEAMTELNARAPKSVSLLLALIRRMSPGSAGVVVCSRETMRELLGVSMPTVERALRVLINEGWVQRIRIGGAHALAINSRVAWIGPRGQLQHAVFEATVIASRTEQDAIALEPPPLRQVPVVMPGEIPLGVGPGLDPPSQPELADMEPPAAVTGSGADLDPEAQAQLGQVVDQLNASAAAHGRPGQWKAGKDPA